MDMHKKLDAVQRARQEAIRKREEAAAEERRLQQEMAERVKAGESTGDRLMDYAAAQWGGDERVAECLRELETAMAGMIGQFVLVAEVAHEWQQTGNGGGFGPSGFDELTRRDISLCVLTDDKLELDLAEGRFGFRTAAYVQSKLRQGSALQAGNLMFDKDCLVRMPMIREFVGGVGTLTIMFGTDTVIQWAEDCMGLTLDVSTSTLMLLALALMSAQELPAKLKTQYDEMVSEFEKSVEDARQRFEQNRAKLLDTAKELSKKEAGDASEAMRRALEELRRLQARVGDLHLDPKPIAELLASYAT